MSAAPTDYIPKAILFTGGAGFIGSNVLLHLVEAFPSTKFVCIDKLDYCATVNNFREIASHPRFEFVKGDIRSADLIRHLLKTYQIDTILHFAAQTHVDNSFGNSLTFTEANVVGTHVLLECTKAFKDQVRRFVHVSTDEVYGESSIHDDKSFDEHSALNPTNPYAATKAAAEFLVKAYRTSFGLPVIITRGNNVFGPRQYPEKLIPKFISLLERGLPCPIHGDGKHRRSYLYVSDVARAFELIVRRGELGQIYNVGTPYEISNLETARELLKVFGYADQEEKYIKFVEDRHWNDVRYNIAQTKLADLGWTPIVSFADGLKKTIDWYRANPGHWGDVSGALVAHPRVGVSKSDSVL
jgi:UDP-glucose 4,6-dehydratase